MTPGSLEGSNAPPQRLSRRRFIGAVAVTGAVAATAGAGSWACSTESADDDASVDATFALPWVPILGDEVVELGRRVLVAAPRAIDHARTRLAGTREGTDAAREALADACAEDGREGRTTQMGPWLLPTTMAGLAAALVVLADT